MAQQTLWLGLNSSSLNIDHYSVISSIWHQQMPSSAKETIFNALKIFGTTKNSGKLRNKTTVFII